MARQRKKTELRVDATVHREAERTNIPTAELEAFVHDNEREPETLLYPRDTALDPQLVWKGKDGQDRNPLAVPSVPIYIQEKISPQALIEDLRAEHKRTAEEQQIDLFGDFNGLEFKRLVEFYQHSQHWTNRMILGDSLLVMASLVEKEGLKGKVQTIYIDPPYGIKFGSNWQVSTRKRDVRDGKAEDATRQPEQVRAYRDTWELGINSYLAYLRDRLVVARDLLAETGSLFVQIGDENVHLVRMVLDEVFGSENFRSLISFRTSVGLGAEGLDNVTNYVVWYSRGDEFKFRPLFLLTRPGESGASRFTNVMLSDGKTRKATAAELDDPSTLPKAAHLYRDQGLTSRTGSATTSFEFEFGGRRYAPTSGGWRTNMQGMARLAAANRLLQTGNTLSFLKYWDDFSALSLTNFWEDVSGGITSRSDPKIYVVQTATKVIERCLLMSTDPGDLVIDPTCGAGTTAYVAEHWGRRWITIDTSRVALALARTRLMTARFPYYLLAETNGPAPVGEVDRVPPGQSAIRSISRGFVYEQLRHVTLKSITNNPEIETGLTREEVDRVIERHAEAELLFDRPRVDSQVVRVSGPMTVESISPHRVSAGIEEEPGLLDGRSSKFLDRIVDYLRRAGVQNTVKEERLTFDRLDLWPGGVYIQASGDYTENGAARTAAVCIGPEYGTVGPELVREAAKEAVKFADLLIVCGFAFDPHVGEESDQLGRLTILKARMNPDLSMGDELLKKTGAANLFMVFGEPDITIEDAAEDKVVAEIRGLDIYDPTTGAIRNHSVDDIACWFIDTDYNGESFFVRHAYFLGADDPYDQLKRALRAEIDEATWATLYSNRSRPFARPESGKIAVKVINHYGDEVLHVYDVPVRPAGK